MPRRLKDEDTPQIDKVKLLAAISEGVRRANCALGNSLFVETIEYVAADSPNYSAYTELAEMIIRSATLADICLEM